MSRFVTISHSEFLALVYHDLFDYPLTRSELEYWKIGFDKYPLHKVELSGKLFCLPARREIILKRTAATISSKKKYVIAKHAAKYLSFVPSIKMVALTGSLAMAASQEDDDIDFLIVCGSGTLWISRIITLLSLKFLGIPVRRHGDTLVKNKLCLNLWLDESSLSFSKRREIYTAHEVLQIKVLFDRAGIYKKFLQENSWVRRFFPNVYKSVLKSSKKYEHKSGKLNDFLTSILKFVEKPAKILQLTYMAEKKSREVISSHEAHLHPKAWNEFVPEVFISRLENLSKGNTTFKFEQKSIDN